MKSNNVHSTLTRRAMIGAIGGLAVAGAGLATLADRAAAATIDRLDVSDANITTDDGTITDVTVAVDGDWQFDGLDIPAGHRVHGVHIYLKAGNPGNEYRLAGDYQETGNVKAASGTFAFGEESIIRPDNVNSMKLADFTDPDEDATPKTTEVGVEVEMVVTLNGPANPQWGRTGWHGANDTTFDVNVTNQPAAADVGGDGTSDVDGENQMPGGPGDPQQLRLVWSQGEETFRVDNDNPADTTAVDYELRLYGSGNVVVTDSIAGGHSGYSDPMGNYHALNVTSGQTVELWAGGAKVDQANRS
ncbi:hypothetical protein ACKVMT_11620 [Halobacteriales archaeon Cl-PHB]